jgi:hypothetical protein
MRARRHVFGYVCISVTRLLNRVSRRCLLIGRTPLPWLVTEPSYGSTENYCDMIRRVALVRTDVSEERIASITVVTGIGGIGASLAVN